MRKLPTFLDRPANGPNRTLSALRESKRTHGGHFYLVAERESANWVRNIQSQPQVKVRVGGTEFNAIARVVHSDREPQLAATVKALFDTKYGWSDGLIAELTPD
jgi:F420H(2)-dependent quinone reductase